MWWDFNGYRNFNLPGTFFPYTETCADATDADCPTLDSCALICSDAAWEVYYQGQPQSETAFFCQGVLLSVDPTTKIPTCQFYSSVPVTYPGFGPTLTDCGTYDPSKTVALGPFTS